MRLYRIGNRYVGTQADARRLAREIGDKWCAVEVPTTKAGLIDYLNGLAMTPAASPPKPQTVTRRGCKDAAIANEAALLDVVRASRELNRRLAALDVLNP